MGAFFHEFGSGFALVFTGIEAFFRQRRYWRHTVKPLGCLFLVYALATWLWLSWSLKLAAYLENSIREWPKSLHFLASAAGSAALVVAILLLAVLIFTTIGAVYEVLGGIFFDRMVICYAQDHYKLPSPNGSPAVSFRLWFDSLRCGLGTWLCYPVMLLALCFLPVIGNILWFVVFGWRYGVAFLLSPASGCRGVALPQLRRLFPGHRAKILGFGFAAYLLLLIPMASLLLLPGIVIGATHLFNDTLMPTPKR